jgi:hypothetical protein
MPCTGLHGVLESRVDASPLDVILLAVTGEIGEWSVTEPLESEPKFRFRESNGVKEGGSLKNLPLAAEKRKGVPGHRAAILGARLVLAAEIGSTNCPN